MPDETHQTPVDDDGEDALHRVLESTHELQRLVFRLARRNFLTPAAVGQLRYAAESIMRDVGDLAEKVGDAEPVTLVPIHPLYSPTRNDS